MTYAIIAALEEELQPLLEKTYITHSDKIYGTAFYKGTLEGNDVVLCQCGIATINAALCTSVAIREWGAQSVINTGIAGALGRGVDMLDVVISRDVMYHNRDNTLLQKYYPFTNCFKADPALIERAQNAAQNLTIRNRTVKTHVGRIVTGDLFIADREIKKHLVETFDPLCVEMEGAAIANTAWANGKPFVIIRTMSDCADDQAEENYNDLIGHASEISATLVLKMLKN